MHCNEHTKEHPTEEYVATGCLVTGSKNGLIHSTPLGSCIAVVAYDKTTKIGGIAHIMLPGKAPTNKNGDENKYATNAIENLLFELNKLGVTNTNIEFCLVGGANVLRKENDTIAEKLTTSIIGICEQKKLKIRKTSLGGYERRTAKLDLNSGIVNFTIGDSIENKLYQFTTKKFQENG